MPAPLAVHQPWIQQCLLETGWCDWRALGLLGRGAWSMAALVARGGRQAVLLLDRPDRPALAKPGVQGTLALYESAAAIRLACRRAGLPVARTLGAPRAWSGGAAVIMARVPGRDLEHLLQDPRVDGETIGRRVAGLVAASQVLGQAHRAHATGFGNHLFGRRPPQACPLDQWRLRVAPLRGRDAATDALLERLETLAADLLAGAPRTTQVWDVGDRNIMVGEDGQVVGLVDQVDMSTGDPLLVPGFSLAMLADVHGWAQAGRYAAGWRQAWELDAAQWARVEFHRLSCHGRYLGKHWAAGRPAALSAWQARARLLLAQ